MLGPINRIRAALLAVALLSLIGASVAAAESFGKLPGPDESRCSQVSANHMTLKIGELIAVRASAITDACDGVSKTHYTWAFNTPGQDPMVPGLEQLHKCPSDSALCIYKVVDFTQPGLWQSVGIDGTSPFGGWGSSVPYAVVYGKYFDIQVGPDTTYSSKPITKLTLTGEGLNESETSTTNPNGFEWPVKDGTLTFAFRVNGKLYKNTVKVTGKPGQTRIVTLDKNPKKDFVGGG